MFAENKENPYSLGYKYRDGSPRLDTDVYPKYVPNKTTKERISLENNDALHQDVAILFKQLHALATKYGFAWGKFPHEICLYDNLETAKHIAVVDRFGKVKHVPCADFSKLQLTRAR